MVERSAVWDFWLQRWWGPSAMLEPERVACAYVRVSVRVHLLVFFTSEMSGDEAARALGLDEYHISSHPWRPVDLQSFEGPNANKL